MKTALITGASSGIGKACAEQLAAGGYDLILLARRQERLQSLKASLEEKFSIAVTCAGVDVSDKEGVDRFFKSHESILRATDVLINNAGLAKGVSKLSDGFSADWDAMIDTNVKGLLYVTRGVLPYMLKASRGHIVNIGSVAGRWTYAGGAVYCATKFAVRALTEGLRMDLLGTPLRVTNIEPGMAETEFSEVRLGDPVKARSVYVGMTPLSADDIAETILWCLSRPTHVNVQELVIFPTDQAAIQSVHRRSP